MDRSSGPLRRRRHGRREARPRLGTGRGDQGELDGMLTSGGERRERPDFCGQRRRLARSGGGATGGALGAAAAR
jgi:hypothetical protein